jgi:hypothetical protein
MCMMYMKYTNMKCPKYTKYMKFTRDSEERWLERCRQHLPASPRRSLCEEFILRNEANKSCAVNKIIKESIGGVPRPGNTDEH